MAGARYTHDEERRLRLCRWGVWGAPAFAGGLSIATYALLESLQLWRFESWLTVVHLANALGGVAAAVVCTLRWHPLPQGRGRRALIAFVFAIAWFLAIAAGLPLLYWFFAQHLRY